MIPKFFRPPRTTGCQYTATLLTLLVLSSAACLESASRGEPDEDASGTATILVSLDGFRWDYPDLYRPPVLTMLADSGVRAEALIPVFPTMTFPNHYTIVTGLYPAKHGIVANRFYDPEHDAMFSYRDMASMEQTHWWKGEPIWITAERQGRKAAAFFWVGSDMPIHGVRPTYWYAYDGTIPGNTRVDQVLDWIDLPERERPDLITLYFDLVDDVAHSFGPESPQTAAAVAEADSLLGRLVDGLRSRGILDEVNIIVVSDHGQVERSPDRVIFLDDYLTAEDARIVDASPMVQLLPTGLSTRSLFDRLHGVHPALKVFLREDLPEKWHLRGTDRVTPVVAVLDEGWSIGRRDRFEPKRFQGGNHGYDNELRSMHGILIARGPAFETGMVVPPVQNIHVYELLADILNIEPAPNDGSLAATRSLRKRISAASTRQR